MSHKMQDAFVIPKFMILVVRVCIVIVALTLVVLFFIPAFIKSWHVSCRNLCLENIWQIERAKKEWAMQQNKVTGDAIEMSGVREYLKDGRFPSCPKGGTYTYNPIGTDVTCSKTNFGHIL